MATSRPPILAGPGGAPAAVSGVFQLGPNVMRADGAINTRAGVAPTLQAYTRDQEAQLARVQRAQWKATVTVKLDVMIQRLDRLKARNAELDDDKERLSAEDFLLDSELVAALRMEGQAGITALRAQLRRDLVVCAPRADHCAHDWCLL